jgi:hypothetical protein
MAYINKNEALNRLSNIASNKKVGFEYFKNTLIFEKVLDEVITFNRKINWESNSANLKLVTTAEEFIKICNLRSEIYGNLGYQKEFPDALPNMNFDFYDINSAIIYNLTNNEITATCRLIFDSDKKLPIEDKLDLLSIRNKFEKIAEVSRLMVKKEQKGLNLDFKYLTLGIYNIITNNNLDASISVILKEHFKLYGKFGGFSIEKELESYGNLESTFIITSWNPYKVSSFFRKAFLQK